MPDSHAITLASIVAPHEGAWIEIVLKVYDFQPAIVAPHEGAWIEIFRMCTSRPMTKSRTPRGCVD